MKTRKALEDKRKPKKSKKMKGLIPHHVYPSFDTLINGIETTLVDEMDKPMPNWSRGAKEFLPHIMWIYNSDDVDASKDRKMEESVKTAFSLCPCAIKK